MMGADCAVIYGCIIHKDVGIIVSINEDTIAKGNTDVSDVEILRHEYIVEWVLF